MGSQNFIDRSRVRGVEVQLLWSELLIWVDHVCLLVSIKSIGLVQRLVHDWNALVIDHQIVISEQIQASLRQIHVSLAVECFLAVSGTIKTEFWSSHSNLMLHIGLHSHTFFKQLAHFSRFDFEVASFAGNWSGFSDIVKWEYSGSEFPLNFVTWSLTSYSFLWLSNKAISMISSCWLLPWLANLALKCRLH